MLIEQVVETNVVIGVLVSDIVIPEVNIKLNAGTEIFINLNDNVGCTKDGIHFDIGSDEYQLYN